MGMAVAKCGARNWRQKSQGIIVVVRSPGGKVGTIQQQPEGLSAQNPQTKQPTGWEHSPNNQKIGCIKSLWAHGHLLT